MYNTDENTQEDSILKQLNNNAYNNMILAQYDTVCLHIVEELFTKELPIGSSLCVWDRLKNKPQPMTGASNIRLRNKFEKAS